MKSKNHKICHDIIISCTESMVKKLRRFRTSYHVRSLQIEASPQKIHIVENELFRFQVKVTGELGFNFKTFV